jgi:hypothetical protein
MIIPTNSSPGPRDYDPWYDINDDGKIDIKDIYGIALEYGTEGEPINKTQIILDLQNRIKALEEKRDYVKTIRIYTPNETMNNETVWKDALVFVWNPRNATNNAILEGFYYFRYTSSQYFRFQVLINENIMDNTGIYQSEGYEQTGIYVLNVHMGGMANQNSYSIKFQISATSSVSTYVKGINILLEVMDGLPPN